MATTNSHGSKTGGKSACKTRLAHKARGTHFAAQFRALKEILQLLTELIIIFTILFTDWPTRLTIIIALICRRKMI
jgi:hypothetical protein